MLSDTSQSQEANHGMVPPTGGIENGQTHRHKAARGRQGLRGEEGEEWLFNKREVPLPPEERVLESVHITEPVVNETVLCAYECGKVWGTWISY